MTTFAWKRFWVLRGGNLNLLDHGYLPDPETPEGARWNPDILSAESLRQVRCLALLGEPGIGKTTALRAEVEAVAPEDRLYIDLREFSSDSLLVKSVFDAPNVADLCSSGRKLTLFLDSLDECLINVRSVATLLATRLRQLPIDRVRLRIACRTADWPELLAKSLPETWGQADYVEAELAPLRRRDVELAAETAGVDSSDFMRQVGARGLVPFAIRPSTLLMLLDEYTTNQSLPATVSELFERGCLELCRERSLSRRAAGATGPLTKEQRLSLADQIAAVTMFARRPVIFRGVDISRANPEDLMEDELVWGTISGHGRSVTQDDLREVLGTELFSGREALRLGWSHWTFPEYLAARFARRVGLSDDQLSDLLLRPGTDGRERVIPQLREIAAWVASERPALLRRIAAGDAQVLLRPGLSNTDAATRAAVTQALLDLADKGELLDRDQSLRAHYELLGHPGLSRALAPYVQERSRNRVARRMAIDIAEACGCADLVPNLLALALTSDEDPHIRAQAAYAILKLGGESERSQLRPLLDTTPQEDPDDEIRGVALHALWPQNIDAKDLFGRRLTLPRNPTFYGAYKSFLGRLPQTLEPRHLTDALEWVAKQSPDHYRESITSDLPAATMRLAWVHLDEPGVLPAFAAAALHRIDQYDPILAEGSGAKQDDAVLLSDERKRRALLAALVAALRDRAPTEARHQIHQISKLLHRSDFSWLLDERASSDDKVSSTWWLELADRAFDVRHLDHVEALITRASTDPILRARMRVWLDPVVLRSDEARAMRSQFEEARRLTQAPPRKPVTHPPLRALIEGWLDRAERGDIDAWWRLNRDMTLTEDSDSYPYGGDYEPDLMALPGWSVLDEHGRSRVIEAGFGYLRAGEPADADWLGKNLFHYPAAAGYRALRLIYKVQLERVEGLEPGLWEKWAASVLSYSNHNTDDELGRELVAMAYRKAPDAFLKALDVSIDKENREHKTVFMMGKLSRAWDKNLAMAVLSKVKEETLAPGAVEHLLKEAMDRFPDVAEPVARMLFGRRSDPSQADRAVRGAVVLLEAIPRDAWSEIWPVVRDDPDFGRTVVETLASRLGLSGTPRLASELGEKSLADFYVWLRREFPEERRLGFGVVGTGDLVTAMRDATLDSLKRRGTDEAVRELRRVASELPDLKWLRYELQEAEELRVRESWVGVSINELQQLASSTQVRVVDTEEQLVALVEQSLARLEERLHGSPPAIGDLWNERPSRPKAEGHLSDYITRHLQADIEARGIIANREVQLRPGSKGDIRIDAISKGKAAHVARRLSVVVEVKGCWNQRLKTDMETQLRDRYLKSTGLRHGLYVVGWFRCEAWENDTGRKRRVPRWTLAEARRYFEEQARELSSESVKLGAIVLDAARR